MSVPQQLLTAGFRIFFLAAGVIGAVIGIVWTGFLWVDSSLPSLGADDPYLWHAHEMIFGYGVAAVGGFFLTAVPNWTGSAAASRAYLAAVFALWAIGRIALWSTAALPPVLTMALDLLFIPVLTAKILAQLLKRPKPQNMMFLTMLSALWVANLLVHLEWVGATQDTASNGLQAGLFALCGMIAVLGGRVTPAFTRNAMKRAGEPEESWPTSPSPTDKIVMVLAVGLPWVTMIVPDPVPALWAGVLGLAVLVRLAFWRTDWALKAPILWSLHLGMAFLGFGLLMWGLSAFGITSETVAIHLLGIGAVGAMTLAVMSRAVLGHTGRELQVSQTMALSYGLMAVAALMRWVGMAQPWALVAAGLAWTLAMLLFVKDIWPMVSQPRVDGRPG